MTRRHPGAPRCSKVPPGSSAIPPEARGAKGLGRLVRLRRRQAPDCRPPATTAATSEMLWPTSNGKVAAEQRPKGAESARGEIYETNGRRTQGGMHRSHRHRDGYSQSCFRDARFDRCSNRFWCPPGPQAHIRLHHQRRTTAPGRANTSTPSSVDRGSTCRSPEVGIVAEYICRRTAQRRPALASTGSPPTPFAHQPFSHRRIAAAMRPLRPRETAHEPRPKASTPGPPRATSASPPDQVVGLLSAALPTRVTRAASWGRRR
jgi:hypothetical protein